MERFSEKVFLKMNAPTEDENRSDEQRLRLALAEKGYSNLNMTLHALRRLHPSCLKGDYSVTVSMVYGGDGWFIADVEAGDTRANHYGIAVDYGSTTIVMQLVDMNSGEVLARAGAANGQRAYGTDILTRITYIMEDAAHAQDMHRVTADTFNALLDELSEKSGIDAKHCAAMIISGNTTMIHFLLELDAWTVFASPYAPVTMDPGWFRGSELDFDFPGMVYIIPAASNYIGGDIVSGLLTMDFYKKDGCSAFFDIGTNGELVMGNRDWLIAGAGAAGPALEGYISRFGMRAQNGTIDTVAISGEELSFTTIGNEKPIGICGSGIIDLLAQMRLNGWINIAGEFNPDASPRIVYLEEEREYAAVYATAQEAAKGEALYFSQTDIRQYLETKAAAHTMIDCLLDSAGIGEGDLENFYLSGAFSAHSNLESAITVGIFPDLPRERYKCIPNSSLDGARTLLLDRGRFEDIAYLRENMYCLQFASVPNFMIRMYAAKFIPHTNMEIYPSVEEKLKRMQA